MDHVDILDAAVDAMQAEFHCATPTEEALGKRQ
jgi:hypothetical protein